MSENLIQRFDRTQSYVDRLAADLSSSPMGHAFFNGRYMEMGDVRYFCFLTKRTQLINNDIKQDFLRSIQLEVMDHMRHLQEKV